MIRLSKGILNMQLIRSVFLVLTAVVLIFNASAANAAQCFSRGSIGPGGRFCNNCVLQDVLVVSRDTPCERAYWGNSQQVVEFLGNQITQKARHGIAGTTGSSLAYAPSKGFTGSDDFIVGVNYKDNNGPGKFFIHFSVTVQ